MKTLSERLWSRVTRGLVQECWEWRGYRGTHGHGQIMSATPGKLTGTHRAAWELTFGPIPPGMQVCHRCDNPPCCNPAHLFIGTQADNNRDCRAKQRTVHFTKPNCFPSGDRAAKAKLTNQEAATVVRLVQSGARRSTVAERYGVSVSLISKILLGKCRKHLNAA